MEQHYILFKDISILNKYIKKCMEIIDRKLTTHRCRKGKESHQGGVMGGFNCTGNVLLPKWCGEYMNAYFISL